MAGGRLGVGDDLRVVDRVEVEREVALQRGVGAANLVEQCDERGERVGVAAVPVANLVLLAVEIFLAAGAEGDVLA